ncbi:MAG TPA: prepilin-type N-terminal cleavage/methylation domain-containing protein [Methylotenera sp.]|nr:prepilin-type N-terminal cleavage/methylation domain-containing protein [Methylotenera sp.]HPV45819.1 prepilin-type N-terminal cleavage/methylation domain-containing protein [Methylotenera sp.]
MYTKHKSGFTLVEMAIVLVIVGLVISAFLTPLTAQLEQARNAEARRDLSEIKEALLGFAVINDRLPCPDNDGDGVDDGCANTNATSTSGGNVPWATLDTKQLDPWGRRYQYQVNNAFSAAFILTTTGSGAGLIRVCTTNACVATEANNVPLVIFSTGQNGAVLPPVSLDEQENVDGDKDFVSHDFTNTAGGFDDLVVWLSTNVLMNRMVSAGRLP